MPSGLAEKKTPSVPQQVACTDRQTNAGSEGQSQGVFTNKVAKDGETQVQATDSERQACEKISKIHRALLSRTL